LDRGELHALVEQLLFAGHETTTNLLGTTLYHLLRDTTLWHAVHADPRLIVPAIEEGLRYDAPVQGMFRTTTEVVALGGVMIPAGARVFIVFGAANHDAQMFSAPERFDLQRPQADQHLALVHGIHYCLGAPLARLEARIAITVLVQRLPELSLVPAQPITYLPSLLNRALQHLEARWGTVSSEGNRAQGTSLTP
jgi:cytochrome P450